MARRLFAISLVALILITIGSSAFAAVKSIENSPSLSKKELYSPLLVKLYVDSGRDLNSTIDGKTLIQSALEGKFFESAKILIRAGAPILTDDSSSLYSDLGLAVNEGADEETIRLLIERGCDPNEISRHYKKPIFLRAPVWDRSRILDAFVKNGMSLEKLPWGSDKMIPIVEIIRTGDLEFIKHAESKGLLLDSKKVSESAVFEAATHNIKPEVYEYLFSKGFDRKEALKHTGILGLALSFNDKPAIEYFLKLGMEFRLGDEFNQYFLNHFNETTGGRTNVVHLFLNGKLETASASAEVARKYMPALLKVLRSDIIESSSTALTSASPNAQSRMLIMAAQGCDLKLVKYFVEEKKLNVDGKPGVVSPLSVIDGKCDDVAEYLIAKGSDPNLRNADGMTAFHSFIERGAPVSKIERWMKTGKARLNLDVSQKTNLLHVLAAKSDASPDVIKFLINKGIDPLLRNDQGLLPFDLAKPNSEIYNILETPAKKKGILPHAITVRMQQWDNWIANQNEVKVPQDVLEALAILIQAGQNPAPPPKSSPEHVRKAYQFLKTAKSSPWDLKADALDVDGMPPAYYRAIINGAQKKEAVVSGKFKPTSEQAKKTLQVVLGGTGSHQEDFDALSWLIAKSGTEVNASLLDLFDMDPVFLRKDVAEMVKSDPLKFKGAPNFAAIKLIKALLSYPPSDFRCIAIDSEKKDYGTRLSHGPSSDILNWFAVYGESSTADRAFFARVARYMLSQRNICDQEKHLLLNAMKSWKLSHPAAQYDIACATADSFDSKPIGTRSFEDMFFISTAVGLKSDLSESAWFEQLKAYFDLRSGESGSSRGNLTQDIHDGLLKYVLGTPEGELLGSSESTKKPKIKIPATNPKKGSILKLCSVMNGMAKEKDPSPEARLLMRAGKQWIDELRAELSKPRQWPKGFTSSSSLSLSLESEFASAKMDADLEAIKTGCESVQKKAPSPAKVTAPASTKKTKLKGGDFDPTAGMKKKKN